MNLPNLITLSRVPLMFMVAALLLWPWGNMNGVGLSLIALVVYIIAGVTDWLDGHLARRSGQVTHFGIYMDALTDKIFMVGMMVTLVALGRQPALLPMVLLVLTREFLITGMRLVAANRGIVVAAEKAGKQKTVTQIIAVGVLIGQETLVRDIEPWTGMALGKVAEWVGWTGLALFLLATYMTVRSGVTYLVKYREIWQDKPAGKA